MEQTGQLGKWLYNFLHPLFHPKRLSVTSISEKQTFYVILRLDFLATYAAEHIDGGLIARELQTILGCHVGLAKDLEGKETKANAGSHGKWLQT